MTGKKCKSGKIIHEGDFWEVVDEMTLKLKNEELILILIIIVANSY